MTDQKLFPYVVSMTFGETPDLMLRSVAVMAPNEGAAIAIAVSSAYVDVGETRRVSMVQATLLAPEFIAAAHRGTAAPAPVVSLVPPRPTRQKVSPDHPCARCEAPAGGEHYDHCPDLYVLPEQQPTPEEWAARFPPEGAA